MIKAIETQYKGYKFRSRLEARWAVFFEKMNFDWKYEAQGYEANGHAYLPDFELRDCEGNVWFVEVKGDPTAISSKRYEWERYIGVLGADGCLPNFAGCGSSNKTGLCLVGDIPEPHAGTWFFPIIQEQNGLIRNWFTFCCREKPVVLSGEGATTMLSGLSTDAGLAQSPEHWDVEARSFKFTHIFRGVGDGFVAARSARFEHGQTS